MQPSKTNNVMFSMTAGLLLTILLIGLIILNSRLVERKASSSIYDYYIIEGVDYANGKLVKTKVLKDKTIAWTKYEKNEMFTPLFTKYNLHHDKPLIECLSSCGNYYIKNPFICFCKTDDLDEWDFWNWEWHFFEDIPSGIFDDDFSESAFSLFVYLNENNLPIEEVQNMYKEFVRVFDDEKKRSSFCLDFIDSHEKQAIIDLVAKTAKTGVLTPANNWVGIGRCILKYRDDFPDNLPEAIMNQLSNTYRGYGDYDWLPEKTHLLACNYLLNNYLLRPTEFNALHTFLFEVQQQQFSTSDGQNRLSCLDEAFTILHKHGLLEKCLSQIYSEDVETPPLPLPAAVPPDAPFHQERNIYYTDTYENLPQREKLLKISCFPDVFKAYWEKRLENLQKK